MGIDLKIQMKVIAFLNLTNESQRQQRELMNFLSNISPRLKARVTQKMFTLVLTKNDLFKDVFHKKDKAAIEEEFEFIGNMLQPLERAPEEKVVIQGRKTSSLFFTVKGQMKVQIEDFTGENREVTKIIYDEEGDKIGEVPDRMEANSVFGEIAYLLRCRRTATVICLNYCSLL